MKKWDNLFIGFCVAMIILSAGLASYHPVFGKPAGKPTETLYPDIDWIKHTERCKETWVAAGDITANGYSLGDEVWGEFVLINRISETTEKKTITTEPGETKAPIPIHNKLAKDGIWAVRITSSLPNEYLEAADYDPANSFLIIDGFVPNTTRQVEITYPPALTFYVTTTNDIRKPIEGYKKAPDGYKRWVELDRNIITLEPFTYESIWVKLKVPRRDDLWSNIFPGLPKRWEFWFTAYELEPLNQGQISAVVNSGNIVVQSVDKTVSVAVRSDTAYGVPFRVKMR